MDIYICGTCLVGFHENKTCTHDQERIKIRVINFVLRHYPQNFVGRRKLKVKVKIVFKMFLYIHHSRVYV